MAGSEGAKGEMIYLTTAHNDRSLIPLFGGLAIAAPIPHGDFNFFGIWQDNTPAKVCGDRKKIGDLVSCINSGRHLQQLQQAHASGFTHQFIIVEGLMQPGGDGLLHVRKGRDWAPHYPNIEYHRVDAYLNQIDQYMGVQVKRSMSPAETVAMVVALYHLFQKAPNDHNTMKMMYSPPPPQIGFFHGPSLLRRVAKELPGIGWERSLAVEGHFESVYEMATATPSEWLDVEGIGKKTAEKVVREIRNGSGV